MSTKNPNGEVKESFNFVRKKTMTHEVGVKSHHWQLKSMLKVDGEDLVYPNGHNIFSYNYKQRKIKVLMKKLSFAPTSFTTANNLVVAGGAKGQLVLFDKSTNQKMSIHLSESINNHIFMDDGRLYVSNNDKTLKIFNTSLQLIKTIVHSTQVNCCSISPDKKYLMVVGDNNEVVVYSNSTYEFIKKFKSTKDGGFSIAWNSTSSVFGVGTQDGHVCLWDIRNDDKLYVLDSKQKGSHKGAIRNVFFTMKNSLDLLCFTEQFSYLTVFDSRTFDKKQVVHVFPDTQITGSAFVEGDAKLFVSSDSNVVEIDVNTVCRRVFEG